MRKAKFRVFILITFSVFTVVANADIYKCMDDNGHITFDAGEQSGKKCTKLDTQTDDEKYEIEREKNDFPKIGMKIYDDDMLCVNYGKALRGEKDSGIATASNLPLFRKELKKRKLKVEDLIIKNMEVKLGMTVCSLYASFGMPAKESKSVGSWGVHIQHIYFESFVYSENGKVTSWQQ